MEKYGGRVNACNKGWYVIMSHSVILIDNIHFRVDHDWILKTYQEKTGEVLNYELETC